MGNVLFHLSSLSIFGASLTLNLFTPSRSPLVPVFSFGENFVYDTYRPQLNGILFKWIQDYWTKRAGMPIRPLWFIGGKAGVLPKRVPITVVGKASDWISGARPS